ncbi:MAG TPA: hypothetical protein VE544_06225, partial [Nitrososphaeraceae archaeon]|nr:hypothetical protein [Nitrososphaeraceae archaeon]
RWFVKISECLFFHHITDWMSMTIVNNKWKIEERRKKEKEQMPAAFAAVVVVVVVLLLLL